MRLLAAEVTYYKSLHRVAVPLDGLTVLIGMNGAGKSNVLEALAVWDPVARRRLQIGGRTFAATDRAHTAFIVEFASSADGSGPDRGALEDLLLAPWRAGGDPDALTDRMPHNIWWDEDDLEAYRPADLQDLQERVATVLLAGEPPERRDIGRALLQKLWETPVVRVQPELAVYLTVNRRRSDLQVIQELAQELLRDGDEDATDMDPALLSTCEGLTGNAEWPDLICFATRQELWEAPHREAALQETGAEGQIWLSDTAASWWVASHFDRPLVISSDPEAVSDVIADTLDVADRRLWDRKPYVDDEGQFVLSESDPGVVRRRDPWLQVGDNDSRLHPRINATLRVLERWLNDHVPEFVRAAGLISLRITPIEEWFKEGRRVQILFTPHDSDRPVALNHVASGLRRWVEIGVELLARAVRRSRRVLRDNPQQSGMIDSPDDAERVAASCMANGCYDCDLITLVMEVPPTVVLIDEPEQHLHPTAHDSVAAWCVRLASEHHAVVVATHSAAFLSVPSTAASILAVERREGATQIAPRPPIFSHRTPVQAAREFGSLLGLGSQTLLQSAAGVLLVEGQYDLEVLLALYGEDVEAARAFPVPINGVGKASAVIGLELLAAVDRPVVALFDGVATSRLANPVTDEEKALATIARRWPGRVTPVSCPIPDVLCALPEGAVRRAFPKTAFTGWRPLIEEFERSHGKGFKDWALRKLDLPKGFRSQETFIPRVLNELVPGDVATPEYHSAVQEALSLFTGVTTSDL